VDLDSALQRASKDLGQPLEWSEQELATLERACATADRAEVLRARFDAEQEGGGKPTELVKLSAELRLLDKQVIDLIVRVNPDLGPAKSDRHQRAARSRWDRRPGA
jgi:hypothetical protein